VFLFLLLSIATATTAIRVDQAGYLTAAPKLAAVVSPESAKTFAVRRSADGSVVFHGRLHEPVFDPDSGEQVQTADFSALTEEGRFYLDVPEVGRSWNFSIGPDAFKQAYFLAMRSYYGQRCGTAVDLAPDFPQYKHAACHLTGAYNASSGKEGPHVSTHGWHDAGDYGRYIVNSGITTGILLWTYELYGDRIKNISLHLPDARPGTPDILTEIRWNLDWMLTMQDRDGGVWQKQTSTHFCPFIMPGKDTLPSEVIGTGQPPYKSSCATADFAAVMAIAARLYRPFDSPYAQQVLHAAEAAWRWVEQNPSVVFHNPPGITTGEYGDGDCGDERLWAAAELFRTTGEENYSRYFLQHYREYLNTVRAAGPVSWSMVAPLALWTYVLGNGKDGAAVAAIRQQSSEAADRIVERAAQNAYRISLAPSDYIWGSNGVAASYSMQLLIADRLQPNRRYVQAAWDNLHYILGRNAFSLSWVTHVGEHTFQHPHHRPSAADGIDAPWPGLMSGGPNPGRQDPVMKKMVGPEVPRAKAYLDDTGAYACNEVAINWNAPLVFALAATLP
jgi:endoglucanase